MQRDFQFYDNEIISYTHTGTTLTLYCIYGMHEKWRTCFYNVASLKGENNLIGGIIAFFGRDNSHASYTLFFRNDHDPAMVSTPDHWRRLPGWGE